MLLGITQKDIVMSKAVDSKKFLASDQQLALMWTGTFRTNGTRKSRKLRVGNVIPLTVRNPDVHVKAFDGGRTQEEKYLFRNVTAKLRKARRGQSIL